MSGHRGGVDDEIAEPLPSKSSFPEEIEKSSEISDDSNASRIKAGPNKTGYEVSDLVDESSGAGYGLGVDNVGPRRVSAAHASTATSSACYERGIVNAGNAPKSPARPALPKDSGKARFVWLPPRRALASLQEQSKEKWSSFKCVRHLRRYRYRSRRPLRRRRFCVATSFCCAIFL